MVNTGTVLLCPKEDGGTRNHNAEYRSTIILLQDGAECVVSATKFFSFIMETYFILIRKLTKD